MNALIIGSNGMLGSAIVRQLMEAGHTVRAFDLRAYPDAPVESIVGDIRNAQDVKRACTGVDTVFQCASVVDWSANQQQVLHAVNVLGNQNVIAACVAQGVERLIYTSSIDVVFDGHAITNGDETLPYASHHLDAYSQTKTQAERDAIAANGTGRLLTCALRPAGIYGPGDRYRFPSVIKTVKGGNMRRLGDGRARFTHVYVENVAYAHRLAAERLVPGSPLAGASYFITDHPASNFFAFFEPFLSAIGLTMPTQTIPFRVAYALAVLSEAAVRIKPSSEPPSLTRYVVASTCRDFYFNSQKAERDFGYHPIVSEIEARSRTVAWMKTL